MADIAGLTPEQAMAFDALRPFLLGDSEMRLAALEGHAGTGKTWLVSRLLAGLPRGLKIAVAAPTNKAVRVLRDKLVEAGVACREQDPFSRRPEPGCTCRSIHSFLGIKVEELADGRQRAVAADPRGLRLTDFDAAVIDECSMIGAGLFEQIVSGSGRMPVLFVGDPAQLPPVEDARISPAFDRVGFRVRLSSVIRQARDNPIIRLSIRLRQMVEAGIKAGALDLLDALPPAGDGSKAALVAGTPQTLVDWLLDQRASDPDGDARIIAYTNARVMEYNRRVHRALHGDSETRFAPGERAIVNKGCSALRWEAPFFREARLIASEELTVLEAEPDPRPFHPEIAAERLLLAGRDGACYRVWAARDEGALSAAISGHFARWRDLKNRAEQAGDPKTRDRLGREASDASGEGWALRRAFAPIRHAHAITCHKSQGSTFDCALVDFTDMAKIADPFEFNRALYVAVTRSREFLALVVT